MVITVKLFTKIPLFSLSLKLQRFFGAKIRTFSACNALVIINFGGVKPALGQRAHGADFNRGARVVLRAVFPFDNEFFIHNLLL